MADQLNVNTGTLAASVTYQNLVVSGHDVLTMRRTLLSGESVVYGQVCAMRTADSKIVPYEDGAGGGDGTAYCVAADNIDASSGDQVGEFFFRAVLNKNNLTLGDTGNTADDLSMFDDLRTRGIYLVDSVTL